VLALGAGRLAAQGEEKSPRFEEAFRSTRVQMWGAPRHDALVLAAAGGPALSLLSPAERAELEATLAALAAARQAAGEAGEAGEGGGAQVGSLDPVQVFYRSGDCLGDCGGTPCNAVLLVWLERASKPSGITVSIDGRMIGVVPSLPASSIPGFNAVRVVQVAAGTRTFRVSSTDNGSASEAVITVVDAQPFSDVEGLTCQDSGAASACDLVARWTNPGPLPASYGVMLDGLFVDTVPGTATMAAISGVAPGAHCVEVVGLTAAADGSSYRGCFVRACCSLDCSGGACDAIRDLVLCQIDYGPGPSDNLIQALWTNGEPFYAGGIHGFIDGVLTGTIRGPTDANFGYFGRLPPGPARIGVQGDCGAAGRASITEATITLLTATPHPNPVAGEVSCSYSAAAMETTATWTNGDPSTGIAVYVRSGETLLLVGILPGTSNRVRVSPTRAEDIIALQFFARVGGQCYGSELVECGAPPPPPPPDGSFIAGICNGEARLEISSAVFLLDYLFRSGRTPPCLAACDCNGDLDLDISDGLCVLNFLFLDGPPPAGWVGGRPACVEITDIIRCDAANPACAS
jgi:hypothetical protein